MLLSDSAIIEELDKGGLVVTPLDRDKIQSASIDLHLDRQLIVFSHNGRRYHDLIENGPLCIGQGDFVLGSTVEWIEIGAHLAGEMVGKSSRAREGLVVESAGYFDPGWKGQGTLEISNRSPISYILDLGLRICQMRFHPIAGKVLRPYGSEGLGSHYQGSRGPRMSVADDVAFSSDPLPKAS